MLETTPSKQEYQEASFCKRGIYFIKIMHAFINKIKGKNTSPEGKMQSPDLRNNILHKSHFQISMTRCTETQDSQTYNKRKNNRCIL